jgi:hypothetical protein
LPQCETDRLLDLLGDDDEAAVKDCANEVHFHTKTSDEALSDYRVGGALSLARRDPFALSQGLC